MAERILELIGFINHDAGKRALSPIEEELCDVSFVRFRKVEIFENYTLLRVTTRTGGGSRLEFKENIRDIRDHSLYVYDTDAPDDRFIWWYFRVPPMRRDALIALCKEMDPHHEAPVLDRKLPYVDKMLWRFALGYQSDDTDATNYSDEEDFRDRYGYWYDGSSEDEDADDEKGDITMGTVHTDREEKLVDTHTPFNTPAHAPAHAPATPLHTPDTPMDMAPTSMELDDGIDYAFSSLDIGARQD
jgi:hypothetical protein